MVGSKIAIALATGLVMCGLVVFAIIPSCNSKPDLTIVPTVPVETVEAVIAGRAFNLELALDDEARYQGLSDRKEIAEDGGMVFAFTDEDERQFVMRRCYVPIDILYLDAAGRVVSMHQMQVIEPIGGARWSNPFSGYPSNGPAQFAVEIQGGLLDELDVKKGDLVKLPLAELKRKAQ